MTISIIVAVAENDVIGSSTGGMSWKLPGELAYFRSVTMGHPIIMGRKTYETIGHPLVGRKTIIVTRDTSFTAEGCEVVNSLEAAFATAGDAAEAFVIGGGELYRHALPLADKLYVTRVHARPEGDVTFVYDEADWELQSSERYEADEKNQFAYTTTLLTRK